jgi:nicotinate phosphoribosyltransferase
MGSRRTHELAAVAAARAAYVAGFASTSNLRAGLDYGVPTAGTSAHAFTLVHDDERQAFTAQVKALGTGTTLLVDTYDVAAAVRAAVELAGPDLGAVRIDSGDIGAVARAVRAELDALGAARTRIIATGDLDEEAIADLAEAPIDGYGVGTALVTGSGEPTAALVYKLVARADDSGDLRAVAKNSTGKPTIGGRKWAVRRFDESGTATAEVVATSPSGDGERASPGHRALLVRLVADGEIVGREPLAAARDRHRLALAELPPGARRLAPGRQAIPTVMLANGHDPKGGA